VAASSFSSSSAAGGDALPVLFSFYNSSCSWRVRIALGLKRIQYTTTPISLFEEDATHCYTDEYRKINPMQQVPALYIDGHTLCDSVAIMQYLEETRSQYPLLPEDPVKRAKVREIVQIICSGIQPLQNVGVLKYLPKGEGLPWARQWINHGFQGLEKVLSESAGKYCVGDEFSMADCCLVPQVYNARRYAVNLDPYPTIVRIDQELQSNEIISACHPKTQPDYPEKVETK
ncbi:hypothetical protein KR222_009955, partial [Zaprionus bogoriensis]